jgi:hypothetical protein
VGFLPYIKIPTRYIFAANHTIPTNVAKRIPSERRISQVGTPHGIRAIITIGEVKGIYEHHTATGELGSLRMVIITKIEIMIGIITGVCNCCASCTESTLEPIAAKIAE